MGTKINKFTEALDRLGDGRLYYWNGSSGVGCSDYVRMALYEAGIITKAERDNSYSLWAGQGITGILDDTTRFKKLPVSSQKYGDIQWFHGAHVSVNAGGNSDRWEAAPEWSHGFCSNKKTGVGLWKNHTYECAGMNMTCVYRIIDDDDPEAVTTKVKSLDLVENAIKLAMGGYGPTMYRGGSDSYRGNVGEWYNDKWHFDCLGNVHTLTGIPSQFNGDRTRLGGGATMDNWVNLTDEAATLASCNNISGFNCKEPKKASLLQSSGHVGIYIGEYRIDRGNGVVDIYNTEECTTAWVPGGGCMLSWVDINTGYRYNKKGGTFRSIWDYHGEFSRVDYSDQDNAKPIMPEPEYSDKGTEEEKPVVTLEPVEKLQLAIDVIELKWGVVPERRVKLSEAYGTDVAIQIQSIVNIAYEGTLDKIRKLQIAIECYKGLGGWGVNPGRKALLTEMYGEEDAIIIQKLINRAYDKK